MPQWCDRHKQHTIDEVCYGCEEERKGRETRLETALKNIQEIAYSGHPDGREARLQMIERYCKEALRG